jgi:hypothetical protein
VRHTSPDTAATTAGFEVGLDIKAPAGRVIRAFFDAAALGAWWGVSRSVTTPRPLGPYVLEWPPTEHRDDVLGRLGGVFRGTVMNFDPIAGFFVADAYYLPPDGEPIGPMAFKVSCSPIDEGAHVLVVQSGSDDGLRWRRYYEVVGAGLERALHSLKSLLEH